MLQQTREEGHNRSPQRREQPAIVIAAFGSTKRGKAVFSRFHHKVINRFGDHDVYWAYTSKKIRRKTGDTGLHETLVRLQQSGYKSCVILPLQVFPGTEYQRIRDTAVNFQGLNIAIGETLLHRWNFVGDVLTVMEKDFLLPGEGVNLLALHGTPKTADPVNDVYLGLEKLVKEKYENVQAAALEGVPDHKTVIARIGRELSAEGHRRVRILPMLLVAGMHVENDLMGSGDSWKNRLERYGFTVECPRVEYSGESYFQSLFSYPEVEGFYLQRLERGLQLVT